MPNTDSKTVHERGLSAVEDALDTIFTDKHKLISPTLTKEDGQDSPKYREMMRVNMNLEAMRYYWQASGNIVTGTINRTLQTIVDTYIEKRISGNWTPKTSVSEAVSVQTLTDLRETPPPLPVVKRKRGRPRKVSAPVPTYKYPVPTNDKPIIVLKHNDSDLTINVLSLDGREQSFKDPDRFEYEVKDGLDTLVVETDDGFFLTTTIFNRQNIIKVTEKRSKTEE